MRCDRTRNLAALGLILFAGVDAARADIAYSVMPFEVPGSAPWTQAVGINDSEQIVGLYDAPIASVPYATAEYGFLYSGGAFTTISVPGAETTDATGINDRGQVVGVYQYQVGTGYGLRGFIYSDGKFSTFDYPGLWGYLPFLSINDRDELVGNYRDLSNDYHSFSYSGGVFTPINYPGATETIVSGINNGGQIVGSYAINGVTHGFLLSGGQFTTIDDPNWLETDLLGINNRGQIVGAAVEGSATSTFVYSDGAFNSVVYRSDLCNCLEPIPALGLNNSDDITGTIGEVYIPGVSGDQGFLATPVPEPSLWPVLLVCLISFVVMGYRRDSVRPISSRMEDALYQPQRLGRPLPVAPLQFMRNHGLSKSRKQST